MQQHQYYAMLMAQQQQQQVAAMAAGYPAMMAQQQRMAQFQQPAQPQVITVAGGTKDQVAKEITEEEESAKVS
jgi:hypothetical protein